jgi:hypothetical protein
MKESKLNMIFTEVISLRSDLKELRAAIDQRNSKKLFTKSETAKILKVSIRTLNNYMREGKINPTYHDRAVRFTQEEIDRYIRENTIQMVRHGI